MFKNESKSGMVTTEVAIGIGLAVVVLFVALGLFNDNLSNLAVNSKLSNLFNGNDSKTKYSSFNRDYSDSQINVQIMGEQGLSMLRRKANNKAIEIIEESFSQSNTNANSIAYLAVALKVITGEAHICAYMKKDSDKHCDEIGGYDYKLDNSGSALTMQKVNTEGTSVSDTVALSTESVVSSVLSSVTIPLGSEGYPTLTFEEKYNFIKNISDKLSTYIRPDVILIRTIGTYKTDKTSTSVISEKASFKVLLDSVKSSVIQAYLACGDNGQTPYYSTSSGCTGYHRIDKDKYLSFEVLSNALATELATATTPSQLKSIFDTNMANGYIVTILADDNHNSPSSCAVLKTQIASINNQYNAGITIPVCTPSGTKGEGVVATANDAFLYALNALNAVKSFFKKLW